MVVLVNSVPVIRSVTSDDCGSIFVKDKRLTTFNFCRKDRFKGSNHFGFHKVEHISSPCG